MTLLYQPPPLDAAGLRILRELRDLGFVVWRDVGGAHEERDEVYAMIEHSSTEIGQRSPMRGYVELRHKTMPLHLLRGIGREFRVQAPGFEARITGVGLAECDRTDA